MRKSKPLGSSYALREPIGRGSTGQLWRATTRAGRHPVAVKVLRSELTTDAEMVARFLQERAVLASLHHPNLVRVRDLVAEGDTLAIVMDLVEGTDLRRHLAKEGSLPPASAVALEVQILDALAAAHVAGVVHRDLKPENVLLDLCDPSAPAVRVTDFGVSRLVAGPGLTWMTGIIGTPEYMAPELAEQNASTPLSDVYAAGIVLYEMLCGHTPFAGGHHLAVLRRQVDEPPHPLDGVPAQLWAVLDDMLAKAPAERLASAAAAAARLRALVPVLAGAPAIAGEAGGGHTGVLKTAPALRRTRPQSTLVARHDSAATPAAAAATAAASLPRHAVSQRRRWIAAAAVVAVVLTAGGVALARRRAATPPATAAAPAAVSPVGYTFSPIAAAGGLTAARTWSLAPGASPTLRSHLRLTNPTSAPVSAAVDEVIPKSVAASVSTIHFSPAPDAVVAADPVVRYALTALAPGAAVDLVYRVPVTVDGPAADWLRLRAGDWATADAAYQAQARGPIVAGIAIDPPAVHLTAGQSARLALTGARIDGSPATAQDLGAAAWATSAPAVATVAGGTVTAVAAGSATITAHLGSLSASATVTVTPARTLAPRPPPTRAPPPTPAPPVALDGGRWNTSFETGVDGWNPGPNSSLQRMISVLAHTGSAFIAAYEMLNGAPAAGATLTRVIPDVPAIGKTYTFQIWVLSPTGAPVDTVIGVDTITSTAIIQYDIRDVSAVGVWAPIQVSLTVDKPGATELAVGITINSPAVLYLDDESVTVSP